jgi:hypothetical protein
MCKQTYIEKLEANFHPLFLAMQINQEFKRWNLISYIKMLEKMCEDRSLQIPSESFPITNNFLYANDQFSSEKCWIIEDETDTYYKIFHYDVVTAIAKNKVYMGEDGKLRYDGCLYVDENINRFSLSFIEEMLDGGAYIGGKLT